MRTSVVFVLALFCALSLAFDIRTLLPCSFDMHLSTVVKMTDDSGAEVGVFSSSDRIMRDGDLDLWMWKSSHGQGDQYIDEDEWTIVWRPDYERCYFMNKSGCFKNENGRTTMTPRPYEWLLEKVETHEINWLLDRGTYEGLDVDICHAEFKVVDPDHAPPAWKVPVTVDVRVLRNSGTLVSISGTAKPLWDGKKVEATFNMQVDFFEHNTEIRPTWFVPSASCTDGVPLPAPKVSEEFAKKCYTPESSSTSAGSRAIASLAAVLLLILSLFF